MCSCGSIREKDDDDTKSKRGSVFTSKNMFDE